MEESIEARLEAPIKLKKSKDSNLIKDGVLTFFTRFVSNPNGSQPNLVAVAFLNNVLSC